MGSFQRYSGGKISPGKNSTVIWMMKGVKFDLDFSFEKQGGISTMKRTRFLRKDHKMCINHVELDGFVKSDIWVCSWAKSFV